MSKPLDERLRVAKDDLLKIDTTIQKSARVVPHVLDEFKRVTAFSSGIDHWIRMLGTRAAARGMLTGLESQADEMDMVRWVLDALAFSTPDASAFRHTWRRSGRSLTGSR
jgi:hypothetical protein